VVVEVAAPRLQVPVGLSPVQGAAPRLQVPLAPQLMLFPPVMPAFAPNYRQPILLQVDLS
jgi:hypothetical protein